MTRGRATKQTALRDVTHLLAAWTLLEAGTALVAAIITWRIGHGVALEDA